MGVAQLERPKTSAPGQYLGYALQPVRLCFHLFDAPAGASASLEHLDDVAVHRPDGSHLLEQAKSALTGNPAADRSVELWKALGNWADLCIEGTVSASTSTFRYYVTPSGGGQLISRLNGIKDAKTAGDLLKEIDTPRFKGKPSIGAGPHILRFLAAGPVICADIIRNFELLVEPDPLSAIRGKLQASLPDEIINDFVAAAIGQAKERADQLIREKKPPIIKATEFRSWFHAFIRKHNLASLLQPTTAKPTPDEIQMVISDTPVFVRQLGAVQATRELMVAAVSDFLRTTADKINWAAAGTIVEESLNELDDVLKCYHTIQADEVKDTLSNQSPEFRGRALYRKCIALQIPLEDRSLPSHFIPGAFNCLADVRKLGWHPDYELMLGED